MSQNNINKRLFVAIQLPKNIQTILANYIKKLNLYSFSGVKLVSAQNLHITVKFLGNISQMDVSGLVNNLKQAIEQVKIFELIFDKITFAPENYPRMVWAKYKNSDNYKQLYYSIEKVAENFINKTELTQKEINIIPHVTLVRFNQIKNIININLPSLQDLLNLNINSCELIESKLTQNGSIYSSIATFYFK